MAEAVSSLARNSAQDRRIDALLGVGLRADHEQTVLDSRPAIGWLEVHSENYFGEDGRPVSQLARIAEHYPISLHGIGLGLGNTDPLDRNHLRQLRRLAERIQPFLVSEHLCWTAHQGQYFGDLLPLPYTRAVATHVAARVDAVQQELGRQLLVENVSSYLEFGASELSEWEFLLEVVERADCGILLDVNNVYVNACNHGYDALSFIEAMPADRIAEIHIAGHTRREVDGQTLLIDTHDQPVCPAVWSLYAATLARLGERPTLLEWDANLPPLQGLLNEVRLAGTYLREQAQSGPSHGV